MTAPQPREHFEKAALPMVIIDRKKMTVEFRDEQFFITMVRDLKKKGFQIFSEQPFP